MKGSSLTTSISGSMSTCGRRKVKGSNGIHSIKTYQRPNCSRLPSTSIAHHHDPSYVWIDDVHYGGKLHLFLPNDGTKRIHRACSCVRSCICLCLVSWNSTKQRMWEACANQLAMMIDTFSDSSRKHGMFFMNIRDASVRSKDVTHLIQEACDNLVEYSPGFSTKFCTDDPKRSCKKKI